MLLFISSVTLAESGAYRTEVIVFRNLEVVAEAHVSGELRSFSGYPDLQKILPSGDSTAEPPAEPSAEPGSNLPAHMRNDLADDLRVVTGKSNTMDAAWRRLRSSKTYRPLVYTAWDQNRIDYYPPMRIHDQQVIDTQLRPPTRIMIADLAAEDPLAAYRSTFYQLDGSVQLRRSRFLHLSLDMEFREEQASSTVAADGLTLNTNPQDIATGSGSDTVHGVFALKQNRQIRTGELQYFDTPYFGVLVLVSAIAAN